MNNHDQLDNFARRGMSAQRAVDRVIADHNANAKGAPPAENIPEHRTVKKKLSNPIDLHWRTNEIGFEYIMRTLSEMKGVSNLSEAERKFWFTRGWEKRLEKMRQRHRKAGIPDDKFIYQAKR